MRYLFFDIEGANCYNFVSKMCTFGYVITNEKFHVNSKVDVIINPESPFDRHILLKNMNAYPVDVYNKRPSFKYFYQAIKNILEESEQLIVGWSVENDVKYIYDACQRYSCKQIKYSFLDLQKVYMKVENLTTQPSLEDACSKYNIELLVNHKSDDDAMLTMQLAKAICKSLKITLQELFEQNMDCCSTVEEYSRKALTREEIEFRIQRRKVINAIKNTKRKYKKSNPNINDTEVYAFVNDVIDTHSDKLLKIIRYIIDCGASVTNNLKLCTTLICDHDSLDIFKSKIQYSKITIISFEDFMDLINKVKVTN